MPKKQIVISGVLLAFFICASVVLLTPHVAYAANPNGITCEDILTPEVTRQLSATFPDFDKDEIIQVNHRINNYLTCSAPASVPSFGIAETIEVSGVSILPSGPVEARQVCESGNLDTPLSANKRIEIFQTQIGEVCARSDYNSVEYMIFEPGYQVTSTASVENLRDAENVIPEPANFNLAILAQERDLVRALLGLEPGVAFTTQTGLTLETPSSLSALRSLQDVDLSPEAVATVSGGTLIFVAVLAIPGVMIQSGFNAGVDRFKQWMQSRKKNQHNSPRFGVQRIPVPILIPSALILSSIIAAASSPTFGFNDQSLRVILTFFGGFLIEGLLLSYVLVKVLASQGNDVKLDVKLGSLLLLAAGVVVTRLTGFEPGFIYGITISVALAASSKKNTHFLKAVVEWALLFSVGLLSWFMYSGLFASEEVTQTVLHTYLHELFSSMTVGALTGVALMMLPVKGFVGFALNQHNKWLWLGMTFFTLIVFFIVVLPFPGSWQTVNSSFAAWTTIFVGYVVFSVVFWLFTRKALKKDSSLDSAPQQPQL